MVSTVESTGPEPPAGEAARTHEDRIARLRRRYQSEDAYLSIERARLYTESWQATGGGSLPTGVRVAKAMRRVYENMTLYLDPDDRIAGTWTERFAGCPIPIERGEYNRVLAVELEKRSLRRFRAESAARALSYMVKKRALADFVRNQRIARAAGTQPLTLDVVTMDKRRVNPYRIDPDDKRLLLRELLPYWDGRSVADRLEKGLDAARLYSESMRDFIFAVPGSTSRQILMLSTCATIAAIQGHVILDYEKVVRTGLAAMRDEVALAREKAQSKEQEAFFRSIAISLHGVSLFARRLAERVALESVDESDPVRRRRLARMAGICRRVPEQPAATFREAVQSLWTIKTAVEIAHPVNLHCFGRLDQILDPFLARDLASGAIERGDARDLVGELLLKTMSQNVRPETNVAARFYHRYWGSTPVTLAGLTPDGGDGTNETTYLFLEAAEESRAVTNISVRVHERTPDRLYHEVARVLEAGASNVSLFNDAVHVEAMRRRGFAEADARDYALMGCVEATSPGRTGSMSASALLLSRLLDITLRNGDSATMAGTIREDGIATGDPDGFVTFDDLLDAFYRQAQHFIEKLVAASNLRDRMYEEHLPAPLISAFMDGCLESGADVTAGGAKYDMSGISMINSIANLTDSLYAIKKLVFDERRFSIAEILAAVDDDFKGHDDIAAAIDGLSGKWGNGHPETDALAARVAKELFAQTYRYRTHRDGPFVVYVISMTTHTLDGRLSIASPDGRRAATPYAASCNPYNVERGGVTPVLRSVAALPFEDVMGCAVNVKFHPTALGKTKEARAKWVALLRTFFALGGAQIQPTVVSTEMLRDARENPERHRDLIVKVGGYSTYFTDLGPEIQDEVIARTEHARV